MAHGVFLSILASALFGSMYYYSTLLSPLNGEEIFGWRMLLTLPMLSVFLWLSRDWVVVKSTAARVFREPQLLWVLPLSSLLLGVQLWLFLWAPLHGKALDVSLGYFMMPLVMVAIGRFYYKDKLTRFQTAAWGLALLGVSYELYRVGSFSWASLLVCVGYPYYFVLRSKFKTDHLGGLWFDMLLMMPLAIFYACFSPTFNLPGNYNAWLPLLVIGLGLLSTSALVAYILASKKLPFSLFGLLGYVEPVLLVIVAFLIGERIAPLQWPTYIAIWAALAVLALEGLLNLNAGRKLRNKRAPAPIS